MWMYAPGRWRGRRGWLNAPGAMMVPGGVPVAVQPPPAVMQQPAQPGIVVGQPLPPGVYVGRRGHRGVIMQPGPNGMPRQTVIIRR